MSKVANTEKLEFEVICIEAYKEFGTLPPSCDGVNVEGVYTNLGSGVLLISVLLGGLAFMTILVTQLNRQHG